MQHHFDEHSRKRLMELLDEKSLTHNTMRSDEVQGFMMALLSGPDALTPEDWLPEVLGEEALFEAKERTEVERLVLALAVDMRRQMSDKHLPDLWLYEDNAGNPDFYTWCNAYLYALEVVPTNWFETVNQEEFEDLFYPIMALGGIYDEEASDRFRADGTGIRFASYAAGYLFLLAGYYQQAENRPPHRGEGGAQRPVPVRQRQEIQSLLR